MSKTVQDEAQGFCGPAIYEPKGPTAPGRAF